MLLRQFAFAARQNSQRCGHPVRRDRAGDILRAPVAMTAAENKGKSVLIQHTRRPSLHPMQAEIVPFWHRCPHGMEARSTNNHQPSSSTIMRNFHIPSTSRITFLRRAMSRSVARQQPPTTMDAHDARSAVSTTIPASSSSHGFWHWSAQLRQVNQK